MAVAVWISVFQHISAGFSVMALALGIGATPITVRRTFFVDRR